MSNGEEVVEVVTVDGLGELEGTDLMDSREFLVQRHKLMQERKLHNMPISVTRETKRRFGIAAARLGMGTSAWLAWQCELMATQIEP